ncbi:hypothetical protein [Neptuniibacter halophilus]|uniref:hypothetical protein n=1 Tax=Neptuniibacter halophilus TaxID=651666 RepID=UPI002573AA08|nr:hypothetical protein [Neptuniibacter halophilus]
MLLFFIAYCTLGICTNLVSAMAGQNATQATEHQHHAQSDNADAAHCEQSKSCEWRSKLLTDTLPDHNASFFFAYLITSISLLLSALGLRLSGSRRYAFARQQYFLRTYPRLHLQKAVFLN